MIAIRRLFSMLEKSDRGATAIEYGLIVALIAVAAIGGMQSLGGGSSGMWGRILSNVNSIM